jgi:hypothetical protein
MVDTCKVFKKPVRCVACGTRQYETLLRMAQGAPVVCVECRQEIDLQHDNSEIFNDTVAFVQAEPARQESGCRGRARADSFRIQQNCDAPVTGAR